MKRIVYITSMVFLLALGSCEKLSQKEEFFLNPEFVNFFKFKEQSAWNYIEKGGSSTAASIEVVGPKEGVMDLGNNKQEFFSYELNSNGTKDMLIRAIADEDKINRLSLFVLDTSYKVVAELFYLEGSFRPYAGRSDVLIEHDTKEINGKTYSDVIEMQLKENEFLNKVFFANKVGIIALEEKSSRELLLSSYLLK